MTTKTNWIFNTICCVGGLVNIMGIAVDTIKDTIYFTKDYGFDALYEMKKDDTKPRCIVKGLKMTGIVWDGNNILYITSGVRILSYSIDTGTISTLAGTGEYGHKDGDMKDAMFNHPTGITMNRNGDIYITDMHRVRKINLSQGTVETIAGSDKRGYVDGDGTLAQFSYLCGIVVSSDGTIYVCDRANCYIRQITDGVVSTLAGNGSSQGIRDGVLEQSQFYYPEGMSFDAEGNLLIIDHRYLRKVDLKKRIVSTEYEGKYFYCIAVVSDGILCSVEPATLLKMTNTWIWERFLWIGHRKEKPEDCLLSTLPKDIINEIAYRIRK